MPPTPVNDILFDRTIRHAHFLQRLSATEANQIIRFLEREVYPDLVDKIEARLRASLTGRTRSLRSTERLKALSLEIDRLIQEGHATAFRMAMTGMRDAAVMEGTFVASILGSSVGDFGFTANTPAGPLLRAIVQDTPVRGEFVRNQWGQMTANTRAKVKAAINIGIAEGEGVDKIVRRLRVGGSSLNPGILASPKHEVRRIVRTAMNNTLNQARELTYAENAHLIKEVRWVSTLDARTSHICAALDGQTFGIEEGPRPPAHHNCRSTTVPITKSWKELGIPLKDAPPGTRASMNGQVPSNVFYPEWLKGQSTAIQNQVLGPTLGKHFRAGRVDIRKFIDQQNRPLSVANILRLEGLD